MQKQLLGRTLNESCKIIGLHKNKTRKLLWMLDHFFSSSSATVQSHPGSLRLHGCWFLLHFFVGAKTYLFLEKGYKFLFFMELSLRK